MGKNRSAKKKTSKFRIVAVVLALAVVLAAMVLYGMPLLLYRLSGADQLDNNDGMEELTAATTSTEPSNSAAVSAVTLPLSLEDGKLEIESLFQFDGINPDCDNRQGDNIASVLLKNTSELFLTEATIAIELSDGTKTSFTVTNLPAGKSAMAFAVDNAPMNDTVCCVGVSSSATWDSAMEPDGIAVSVDGVAITLTNLKDKDIPEVIVYCRAPFGEEYFGGITYEYKINDLPANGTATIEAIECIMGLAEVVRIAINYE